MNKEQWNSERLYRLQEHDVTMDTKLFSQAILKILSGFLIAGSLLFLPAGTFAYWQAWLFLGILFIPMFIVGLIMMKKSPDLLRKRLNAKEEQSEQKTVIILSGLMFLAAFIVAGLNFRFGWIVLPAWVSYVSAVVFLFGYALYPTTSGSGRLMLS